MHFNHFLTLHMAAKEQVNFIPWLCQCLNSLGLDGEVYGEYIASSLQSLRDCAGEERMESVMELWYAKFQTA